MLKYEELLARVSLPARPLSEILGAFSPNTRDPTAPMDASRINFLHAVELQYDIDLGLASAPSYEKGVAGTAEDIPSSE